jgi:hypothetical protein
VNESLNEVLRVRPLRREAWLPLYRVRGQVTAERWVLPTQVVESPREGEMSKLGLQSILSCLGVIARPGMAIIVVLLPTL